MKRTNIVLYADEHNEQLYGVLDAMAKELFPDDLTCVDVDKFVSQHSFVYVALDGDKVVGVSGFVVNDYFGLRTKTVGNTYIYVLPKYRGTRAMYLFSLQAGFVSLELNMPLEHYYASKTSKALGKRMFGDIEPAYETIVYNVEQVKAVVDRLRSKLNIKDRA
jgi:hypothetical protein